MFFASDLKYPLRLLSKRPRFTALTVLVLAGGLAVSLYTYSVLNTMVYKALPIPDGASVVRVLGLRDGNGVALDAYELAELRSDLRSLSEIGVFRTSQSRLGDQEMSRAASTAHTEWNIFEFTRTRPVMGRGLVQADHLDGAEAVAVIGYELWQSVFAGDADVIGRVVEVNGQPTTVVGVMPEGYGFPISQELWLPLPAAELDPVGYEESTLHAYARLRPGFSAEMAGSELSVLLQGIQQQRTNPESGRIDAAFVASFQSTLTGQDGPLFFGVLNVVSLFILLLACVNVGNLLLARTNERIKEISLRVALGAPRWRLMLQMIMENGILCVVGVSLALALVSWALGATNVFARSMAVTLYADLPFWWSWHLDRGTIIAAAVFMLATIFVVSILPMYSAASADPGSLLRDGTHRAGGHAAGPVSKSLVAVQIALMAAVMLVGSALATAAYRVAQVDFGMDTTDLYRMPVALTGQGYDTPEQRLSFYERLLEELRRDVGIDAAMVTQELGPRAIAIDGAEYVTDDDYPTAALVVTSETPVEIGTRLLEGRHFDNRDSADGLSTMIVSETLARTFWPDGSAVGRRIRVRRGDASEDERIVVGVVSDVRRGDPYTNNWATFAALYVPLPQAVLPSASVIVRHRGDDRTVHNAVYRALGNVDAQLPPGRVMNYSAVLDWMTRFAIIVMNVFVGCTIFAILLAMVGIYGLSSNAVVQRTHEIGLRRAMGASDGHVIALFLKQGSRQLALGLMISALASLGLLFVMARLEPTRLGAVTLTLMGATVALIVAGLVLTAIYIAIRRAVRYEPGAALRYG